MTDQTATEPPDETPTDPPIKRRRKPWLLIIPTAGLLAFAVLGNLLTNELDDTFAMGVDIVNFVSFHGVRMLMLLWTAWILIFSGWRWVWRATFAGLLLVAPMAFAAVFRPVVGGDVQIMRFEPIWRSAAKPVAVEEASEDIDLGTETAGDFPRFLGPDQSGAVDSEIDAARFGDSEILWTQTIGHGWSGFVARNGYAVTMEQRGASECVSCYEIESGRLVWLYQHTARHRDKANLGHIGPRATPTLHDGKVYAMGAVGNFVCLDGANGNVLWQHDLNELLGIELIEEIDRDGLAYQFEGNTALAWGRAGSPLVVDNLVTVLGGGPIEDDKTTLIAFDANTGEVVWRSGDEMIAYGSPTLATVAGVRQILLTAESKAMAFDPVTGNVLWQFDRDGQTDSMTNTSQLTVASDNEVMTTKGYPGGGGELIRVARDGDELTPESIWYNARVLKTKLTNPVIYDGHAYAISNGFMDCTDLADGSRVWKERGRFGHGQILRLRDKILIHSESGTLHLIDASPDGYNEHGKFKTIDGICWNTLCLFGNKLLVRSDIEAACIALPVAP